MNKDKDFLLNKSKVFCFAPWMSIHAWPNGNAYPCCMWNSSKPIGFYSESSIDELMNSNILKETRIKMLNEERVEFCKNCYHQDNIDRHSYRMEMTKTYKGCFDIIHNIDKDGGLKEIKPKLWDIRFSNICNFKCRTCGPELSSSWYQDAINIKRGMMHNKALINISKTSNIFEELKEYYDHVEEIYFAGGEPLIMNEHYLILDELIKRKKTNTIIRYSTNFSVLQYKHWDVLDLWKHFPNLSVYISVDGIGDIGEYIRCGFKTDVFLKNVFEFFKRDIKPKNFAFMITYGTLNYLHLFDFIIEIIKNLDDDWIKRLDRTIFDFCPINYPKMYDCSFLPTRYKEQFYERFINFENELREIGLSTQARYDIIKKLSIVYIHSTKNEFNMKAMNELVAETVNLDGIRNESFSDTFPYYGSVENLLKND